MPAHSWGIPWIIKKRCPSKLYYLRLHPCLHMKRVYSDSCLQQAALMTMIAALYTACNDNLTQDSRNAAHPTTGPKRKTTSNQSRTQGLAPSMYYKQVSLTSRTKCQMAFHVCAVKMGANGAGCWLLEPCPGTDSSKATIYWLIPKGSVLTQQQMKRTKCTLHY